MNICGYLESVMHIVRRQWVNEIPSSARGPARRTWRKPKLKSGSVKVEFFIAREGEVHDVHVVDGSGDDELDAAAVEGIRASDPLPALPRNFKADSLRLRFSFYYNPTHGVRPT